MNRCMESFPNTTKLTLKDDLSKMAHDSIPAAINRILPLEQLQTSVTQLLNLPILNLIEILYVMLLPRVQHVLQNNMESVSFTTSRSQNEKRFNLVSYLCCW
ncbi:unnamed protein product [Adineta ricciae]|uniref:Uncharacterized protein n=1 Tax=Adineta ricciae TaxID=249248 RepID=A0A815C8Y3_ADIRI|nr:unnamed protein product [Adineta ricciae]